MNRYVVLYEKGRRNWSAYVPDLPGCIATGKTRRAVARAMREALVFHIEGLQLAGETVPAPTVEVGSVAVP